MDNDVELLDYDELDDDSVFVMTKVSVKKRTLHINNKNVGKKVFKLK